MSKIEAWKTSISNLEFSSLKELKHGEAVSLSQVNIIPEEEYQEVMGFGGAFNELGWEAISCLTEDKRKEIFDALFTEEGCNFTLCRTPIGASDFALDAYSLNDVRDDFEMKNFSIERDKKNLIPYLKEGLKTNPGLKIWSCPWSPPYWMKTTDDMCSGGELIDTVENLRAYAKYLAKYIEAYKNEGVDILGFCVQNETDVINVYPTSTMSAELMQKFIRAYLIPEIMKTEKKPLKTEIWVGTIRNVKGYADVVVNDPVLMQFVKGIAYQYSSADTVGDSYSKHSAIKHLHTESPCHNGRNAWDEAEEIFKDVVMYMENGCVNYCYWNMVLNETGFSTWNWMQNSMITVDREKNEVIYNPEFYVMKHFSHSVMPGARRIKACGEYEGSMIAFKNPDGSIVFLTGNFDEERKAVRLNINGESFERVLEGRSIYSYIIK
ncbi:MAG: glycoside hydrolase family 30 beta sandwich domain-containing protein [Bacillota bacterium]|nr:glycoside hydrolase family 30 beta sandwich domain-containing protein [Bacillota bacterium]